MLVQVTKEHLERGIRADAAECAVALACRDLGYVYVLVENYAIAVWKTLDGPRVMYRTPAEVCNCIYHYDRGEPVEPFSFILDTPLKGSRHDL